MRAFKYVMFKMGDRKVPIIFPSEFTHKFVAAGFQSAVRRDDVSLGKLEYRKLEPVSAGFIEGVNVYSATGDSETMGLKSDPEDRNIINAYGLELGYVGDK